MEARSPTQACFFNPDDLEFFANKCRWSMSNDDIFHNLDFCQNFFCELIAENSVHTEISSEISSLQKSQKHTSENKLWFSILKPIFIIMYATCN